MYKEFFSAVAIALTVFAFYPYIRAILRGSVKPHVFSWVIWAATTFIVFLAQLEEKGGAGAWAIGVSGTVTGFIAVLALIRASDISITGSDWLFFLGAMASLPLWYFTADPLWAVVLLTAVDVLGFGPTVRKAYHFPFEEQLTFFALFTARNLIVILALERYSVTTVLFPAVIAAACSLLMVLISYRRRVLSTDRQT